MYLIGKKPVLDNFLDLIKLILAATGFPQVHGVLLGYRPALRHSLLKGVIRTVPCCCLGGLFLQVTLAVLTVDTVNLWYGVLGLVLKNDEHDRTSKN